MNATVTPLTFVRANTFTPFQLPESPHLAPVLTDNMNQHPMLRSTVRYRAPSYQTCSPRRRVQPSTSSAHRIQLSNHPTPTQSPPLSSFDPWLPRHKDETSFWSHLPSPNAAETSTPSSVSSSSLSTIMTPISFQHERPFGSSAGQENMTLPALYQGGGFVEMPADSWSPSSTMPLSNTCKQAKPMSIAGAWDGPSDFWFNPWSSDKPSIECSSTHPPPARQHLDFLPPRYDSHDSVQQKATYTYPTHTIPNHTPLDGYSPTHYVAASSPPLYPALVSPPASPSFHSLSAASSTITHNQPRPVLHQPQPIRPIPLIPLSRLSSSSTSTAVKPSARYPSTEYPSQNSYHRFCRPSDAHADAAKADLLSQFSLLYQPAPNSVRFPLKDVDSINAYHLNDARVGSHHPSYANDTLPSFALYRNAHEVAKHPGSFHCVCGCLGAKHSL